MIYFECFSGISGDMTVAALLDLGQNMGIDMSILEKTLKTVPLTGYDIKIGRVKKCGIDACDFNVILHDHDHAHHHEHEHSHEHKHEHNHSHEHEHRNINDIIDIINASGLTDRAKELAKEIFAHITKAEAKAHGISEDKVHFHEVGAVDSIVDILATAICIDALNISKCCISLLYEGQGYVKCQHGKMPVPVPAVLNMAQDQSIILKITETKGEMITPTGIGILCALKTERKLPENYGIKAIGIGAGKKDFAHANILRIMLLDVEGVEDEEENLWVLESNIDDSTPQNLGFVMELLLENGALDVYFSPIIMKKHRPAHLISILCRQEQIEVFEDILFKHSTTIGIRCYAVKRKALERKIEVRSTPYGQCRFKICTHKGKEYSYPEYDDVKELCLANNYSFEELYNKLKSL